MTIGVRLMGGIGNMLFQIAFGETMAKRYGCDVVYTRRKENFEFIKSIYTRSPHADEYLTLFPNVDWDKNQDRIDEIKRPKGVPFHYTEVVPEDGIEYVGYFQSEKYFFGGDFVRGLFAFKDDVEMDGEHLCSIHIRRADYLTMPDFHPVQTMKYYTDAMEYLYDKGINYYLVFSDDMNWAKENFKGLPFIFPNGKDYEDLKLMTKCQYHIIANSSLSWWGAYLADGIDVIAPKRWLGKRCMDNPKDIIPSYWIPL
jgi:hypothetical protein